MRSSPAKEVDKSNKTRTLKQDEIVILLGPRKTNGDIVTTLATYRHTSQEAAENSSPLAHFIDVAEKIAKLSRTIV